MSNKEPKIFAVYGNKHNPGQNHAQEFIEKE